MSTSWGGDDRYAIPPIPFRGRAGAVCLYSDWDALDAPAQYLEYRRIVSELARRGEEDGQRIAELETQLDTAQAHARFEAIHRAFAPDGPPTLSDVADVVGDYMESRPWVQVVTWAAGSVVSVCAAVGAPIVWSAITHAAMRLIGGV